MSCYLILIFNDKDPRLFLGGLHFTPFGTYFDAHSDLANSHEKPLINDIQMTDKAAHV